MIDVCLVRYDRSPKDKQAFDTTCEYLKKAEEVNLIVRDNTNDNVGLVKARNELSKQGDSEFVCFMDFDFVSLEIDWGSLIAKCREKNVGLVYPKCDTTKGDGWTNPAKVHCHVLMMKREVFDKIGGFDEDYFVAYADWDIVQRLRRAGYATLQHEASRIQHMGLSGSNPEKKKIWDADRAVYRKKWNMETLHPSQNKIIIYDKNNDHHPRWLPNLKNYLTRLGYEVSVVAGVKNDEWWANRIKGCRHLFMWNGAENQYQPVKAICNAAKVGWSVVEVGWFPQSKNWFVDPLGINADASIMDDDLSWVGQDDYDRLAKLRKNFLANREWKGGGDYVLVPLQLEWDTNILLHSPYKRMQEFIKHCEAKFPDDKIIFKRHPHDRAVYQTKHQLITSGSFLDYAEKAKLVYGINSTALLEAALMRCPVEAIGNGYMKKHGHDIERLLACLASKQIHIDDVDLSRQIDPMLNKQLPGVPTVVVDTGNASELKKAIDNHCDVVEAVGDLSQADIVVTDKPETIIKAGRLGVAVVAYATPDIAQMINHEQDGFIYLNNDWMIHWVSRLSDEKLRKKVAAARKKRQVKLDNGVTVVIPCYKQAHLLERSISSVMKQTDKDFKIIVVDDGSPDDVPAAFAELKKKWPEADMKLIRQSNRGLSGARNSGFEETETGWVIPLDADDELLPDFIARTKAAQWKHRADIVFTDVITDKYGFATMNFMPNLLTKRNTIVCTCLIRKEAWKRVGGYDEAMRMGYEDWEFWIRCVQSKVRFAKADGGALFHYHDEGPSMLQIAQRNIDEVMAYVRSKHWRMFAIPRVSVVIPCYNQAKYLERCIESVLNQTEKDVEIIVVDDGSPDDVRAEVNRLHVKFQTKINLVTQENKGLPEARNAGFAAAKAEWVLPLDADDRLGQPDYIERCLQKEAHAGVIITDGLSESGKRTNSCVDLKRLRLENTMHACQMIRKSIWRKLGGYNPKFRKGYEDWEFWIHCLEKEVNFVKAEGIYLLIDDTHEGRMTPEVQKAETYWELLGMIRKLHPEFFIDKPSKKKTADLTVVLSSYNQRKELELVLESYKHQTMMPKEVIINDDGSTDGTLEYLDSLTDLPFELRYVTRQHSWYRLASGNNSAAKHAKGRRILFTNGDQIHCPTSFEAHDKMEHKCVGGGIFNGIAQGHAQTVTKEMVVDWQKVEKLQKNYPSAKNNAGYMKSTNPNVNPIGVWGGNFSVPSSIFREIGGYNEEYDIGWGGEENDLVKRCVMAGCHVKWVTESEIFHLDHPIRAYAYSMHGSHKYIKEF